jgi:FkbM family methyltransferase
LLPEGKIKQRLCKSILSIQNSVPLYLAVNVGDTAVQVGTPNVYTMKRYSRLVGSSGKVIIIEAEPRNAAELEVALGKMPYQNVTIVRSGAWSSQGKMVLEQSDDFKGDHKLKIDGIYVDNDYRTEFGSSIEIEVDTVDNILKAHGFTSFDYLSVTVNGAELEVLKGSELSIRNSSNCRIFSKGHARVGAVEAGPPLNLDIKKYFEKLNLECVISKGEAGHSGLDHWKMREGDVFAWKG